MANQLRAARRARGWSQTQLIHEIEHHAQLHGLQVASTSSLRVYVSEWENDRRTISVDYAAILRGVLGLTDDELLAPAHALAVVDGYDELVQRINTAQAVGRTMVDIMTSQTELLRTMDRQIGAAALVDQMSAHLGRLQDTLAFAVLPDTRRPVARALAEAASMAAWQALDVGAADRAWRHYELAKTAAREADDPLYLAHCMGEQAFVLADSGKPALGAELIQHAQQSTSRQLSPRLSAWLAAAEAELLAHAGQAAAARRALDRANAFVPAGQTARDPDMRSVFLNEAHMTRWRGHTLALVGDERAIDELHAALAALDGTFVRAKAGIHCDLAQAHQIRGEHAEANTQLREARLVANRTASVRHRRRVERLSRPR